MNIKQFVSESLVQIVEGINDAAAKLKGSGALVNPENLQGIGDVNSKHYGWYSERDKTNYKMIVESVDFDVAVTASASKGTEGGIGLSVASITLGSKGKSDSENISVSRLKFTIPIVYPQQKRG